MDASATDHDMHVRLRSPGMPVPRGVVAYWRDLWLRTALEGAALGATYFVGWHFVERWLLGGLTSSQLHGAFIVRGVGAALMLGTWSFLRICKARLDADASTHEAMAQLGERVRSRTRELEEARAFTELLFNSLRERIVVVDSAGRIVKANRYAEDAARDPVERVWEVERIPVPDEGGGAGFVLEVRRDVTQQKNLEAQLRHQEKMAGLGMLTAGFAHDLGNPLASLSTELELLEDEDDVSQLRESLGVLRRQVARMSRTLREMVDFARRRRDEISDVSIDAAVADAARLVRHDPRWKHVELAVDIPKDLPSVHMVEDHLLLVLVNLMLNAADAMPSGGALVVSAVRATRDGRDGIELRVRDDGTGMPPDVLARAKAPMFTTKGASRGTGLGLSVCEETVRSVGGTLDLTSVVGAGTEVSIYLPTRASSDG